MPDYYLLKYLFVKWLHIGPGKKVQLYIYIYIYILYIYIYIYIYYIYIYIFGNFIFFHFATFRY